MYKVLRSYSKKAERKHESSRAADSSMRSGSHGQQQQQHHSSGAAGGGGSSSYYEEHRTSERGGLSGGQQMSGGMSDMSHSHMSERGGTGGSSHHITGSNGQLLAIDNRHLSNTHRSGQAFSESSRYETNEHFERRVQKVKKSRGERERSRSARRGDEVSEALHGSDAKSARDALLEWARRVTAGYPRVNVTNFSSSWRDGLAFNAILHRYRPNLIDWNKISDPSVSNRERLANAFAAAEKEFGVERLLDPEDVDIENPDEKSIITYVSSLYNALPHLPELSKGNLNDLISRLTRGIGITNEKLDLILQRIEDVEARIDTSPPGLIERQVTDLVEDLNVLESPINGFFDDVETLKSHNHPEANDFYRQVYGLHQRRTAYLDRLTNQILVRLGIRTDTLRKENANRLESIRQSTFSRVEECIEWVRVRLDKLTNMEFLEDLETLEEMFEQHKIDNRDIQDFRQNVDECIARQAEVSAEDTHEYCELLRVLESEYQQLRDLSAGRMLDLDSLIAFVRAAQLELVWVSEREEIEVTRNWSDIKQLDLPMLTNYYKQLLHEMELREKQYNDVHNQGAALLNQGHPAVHVIEVYLRTMQNQWDWLLALSKCLEEHLRDALNLKSFLEEASDAESWMEEQAQRLENNYNRTDFSLEEGERYLRELDEIKEILNKYHSVLMALTERCATISPLWQRGERIQRPITVVALCDYNDKGVTIKTGDECVLLDNSDLIKWHIRDLSGQEGTVPSVVFRIPPPDPKLTNFLSRLLQQFEKLKKLWEKKHRMVRFNMVLNTMKTIQGWDQATFDAIDPEQRDAILKALIDDTNKLLSELDPNDPLALRLKEELKKTIEHFMSLLNNKKQPEDEYSNLFDQKIAELLKKLEEAWRRLTDNVGKPISRNTDDLERVIRDHKAFEDALQSLDADVANVKELFRMLPHPNPTQIHNHDAMGVLWENLWDLSRMYVERIKVLESVLNGVTEVTDIVKQHEITLNSFDDLPAALDKLRGHHAQLLEINMVLKQQQTVIDQLNKNMALLRQHVARTRVNESHHPDVDALEDEVQRLNVRWENVNQQVADRLIAAEKALQIQMVYRSEYETELSWLDSVEETINRLRRPEDLRPEEYQQQLDILIHEYAQLQEHTAAIEKVNREGGQFIREAKAYDAKMAQYGDAIVGIHGPDVRLDFRRTKPQPKNGAQIVTEELEKLNRRFAELSSLILEKRNTMQVLIQNWKRQKQENVIREASLHQGEIVDIQADLGRFRDELYTTHLTFHLSPKETQSATKNVQNIKESLDSWRDRIKARLDAVDELCAEGAATMPPEQYAALREKRNQLAGDYENVLRTVEGVYQRLNVLTSLLIEFSSLTSSMQSWMTDRTRLVGDVRIKSADPQMLSEARREARSLLDEITREESRLKAIGSVLARIEEEIAALYAEAPSTPENAINANEVRETKYRVEDDYNQLVKQCQDLLQFQNRIEALSDEHKRQARNADDWLSDLERSIQSIEQMNLPPEEKLRMIDELNRQAAGEQSRLEDAEQASRKLLGALEGSEVLPDVKRLHEGEMAKRRNRHDSALERLQQNVNSATAAIAASEGVKDSVSNLVDWAEQFGNRIREPKNIPLKEKPLLELKQEEQLLRSELDSRLALADEMKGKLAKLEPKSRDAVSQQLHEAEQRLQKSATHLRGFRDNLNDALTGVQTLAVAGDKLSRDIDSTAYLVRATPARDEARIADAQKALDGINRQMDEIKQTIRHLEAIPNAIETDDIDNLQKNLTAKINAVERELGAKRERQASLENLEAQFDDAKDRAASWLNRFEDDLKKLTPVSIERPKLQEQRKELANFADRHQQGHGQMDELEAVAHKLIDAENSTGGGPRSSATPRIVADLQTKYNNLGDALKSRGDKINKNEQRAIDVENAAGELADRIAAHRKALSQLPLPLSKDDAVSQLAQLERMDKSGRGEQRRLDELRIRARELANEAGDPEEAQTAHDRERKLADEWDNLTDDFDAARARAHTAEKLLEGAAQVDKWLNGKKRMVDAIGLPSTEPGVGRTQLGQVQLMKAETDSEKPMLDKLIDTADQLAQTDADKESVSNLQQKISDLNRRWKSLEDNLNEKEDGIAKAAALGNEIRALQKEMRQQIGELEIGVDKAVALPPGQVEKQLATLDELKSNVAGLDKTLAKLDAKLDEADEIPIDVTNRNDIAEAISGAKKKADEVAHKIDNVKAAALSMRTEGLALEEQLDGLLQIARQCQNELEQAPPITADINKLTEQSKASGAFHGRLIGKEGDVSLIRAKVADQLKKTPDAELKAKSDELSKIWPPLLIAAKDRQMVLGKVADLVQQFDDSANALENRLKADENELDEVISNAETDPAAACDALKLVESTMDRRLNETETLAALANRIENAAPGPDSNKLKRKADNMNDDAKNIVKRARATVSSVQRKLDLNDKFEKLIDGAHQYLEEQNHGLKSMVGPALNRERVHSMLADVDGFWNRRHRELRATGDELQKILKPEEAAKIPEAIENVDQKFSALISALKNLENQLDEKKDAVEKARERTRRLVGDIQSLNQEIGDFDHIGRSRAELAKQLDECNEIDEKLNEKDAEVDKDLADWDDSFRDGVVTEPQLASNKAECDEAKRLIARAKKRLGQREKGIKQTQQEVEAIEKEAENLIAQLNAIQDADELKNGHTLVDPKKQAEKIKHLKEQLKPLSEKVDDFVADCKVLIKTAGPESDTSELDKALHDVNHAWSAVSAALADRELAVDAAVQQMGHYEDAHRALLNWLEETEEMVENQKPPAADAKVAKAQHHAYDVLLKHIEDKQASVNGFSNLIDKMIEAAPAEEKKALKQKDDQIQQRYKDLLANAHDKQARLLEAVDLAERLSEISVPLEGWLTQAEKRLVPLGKVPTTVERARSQEEAQHNLAGELDGQQAAVDDVIALAPMLCALVSVDDAAVVEQQCRALSGRHEALRSNLATMQEAMASLAEQIGEFTANKDDMEAWLADTERRILELDELPIAPDDLIEQSNIVADLAVAVAEKDQLMTDIIETGRELCRQSEGDEAMQLQQQIDNMKIRYADIMSLTDEKLTLLTKAIPLSERFHDGFEDVIRWTEAVEQDLATLDEADLETQAHFLYNMEDDITKWRPEVDDLTAVSTQLQALCSPERAEELYQNTAEMNKIVNQIADKVGRRVERMDLADKQSRAIFDDLDFLVDWLSDARDRLIAAGPPSIDPEFLKTQLRNQKLMNDDVAANRTRLRDVIAEARKLTRQLEAVQGEEGAPVPISPLTERCDLGKQLIDEVGDLCTDRTEQLERAYVLAQQLANEFDELNDWCDDMEQELAQSPAITTVTPQPTLKVMHEHNAYLAQQVSAYRPIIDRFENDVRQLQEICAEPEAAKLAELAGEVINRYNELRDNIASRGAAIDSTIDATSGFGERLETFVQNLQGAADRLRDNDGISADPAVLQGRLAENQAILDSLRQKEAAYAALKESAAELLSAVPQGDTAGAEVAGKLEKLEKLWKDIEAGAAQRGQYLEEVLNKAKNFWSELDQCQKAVDDLRVRLEAMEPATGQPLQLQAQQAQMHDVNAEMARTEPRITALTQAGVELASIIPAEEQAVIDAQVGAVHQGWNTITALFAQKNRDLVAAMDDAMAFHGDLQMLLGWLDGAEKHATQLPMPEHLKIDDIPALLDEIHKFKDEIDQKAILKEQLAQTANKMAAGAPAHLAAVVREPIAELNARWARLYGALADRQHKVESALLHMGHIGDAADQLIAWMDKTKGTLNELTPTGRASLREIEIQQCKLTVVKNDVHAHEPRVASLNQAAARLVREDSQSETAGKINTMNDKWRDLNKTLDSLSRRMDTAKGEIDSVGGEMDRWLGWLDDVEQQLATTKPTGGLPETAEAQMDDFRMLKAEIEGSAPQLDAYIRETDRYLTEHGNDTESWIGRNHPQIKQKWAKVKELTTDREHKLRVALDDARALEAAMHDTEAWLKAAEAKLAKLPAVSRVPEPLAKQIEDHEEWTSDVSARKQIMAENQAAGARMQYYCEKKDAIPIKNKLVSLKHQFERVQARTAERAKQLQAANDEVQLWMGGVEELEDWMGDMEQRLEEQQPHTANLDKLKQQLDNIKETQKEISRKQPLFDITKKRGITLAEHAPKQEIKQIIARNDALARRWSSLVGKAIDRLQDAEQAVIEGGAFEEAVAEAEKWADAQIEADHHFDPAHVDGDIDTVRTLVEEDERRADERKAKKQGLERLLRKADELIGQEENASERQAIEEAKDRLMAKWDEIEDNARSRSQSLKEAEKLADDFDAKAHGMLDWLAQTEQKLKGPTTDLAAALELVEQVKAELEEAKPKKEECIELAGKIQDHCHPKAEQPIKNWKKVIDGRWKEVADRADDREFALLEQIQNEKQREEQLQKMLKFVGEKKEELAKLAGYPPAENLEILQEILEEFAKFQEELREKQPEVDAVIKGQRKGVRNPAVDTLNAEWQQLWMDAMGLQSSLDNHEKLLEEMKRLEGWQWEDWKDRYLEWNDHIKARVTDLFRRIDRSHTGFVPREVFIDAIIQSRFETSRLEMNKVADLFDKDGMINSKQFIDALRFDRNKRNREPVTPQQKISEEIRKQATACKCCQPFLIEKIGDMQYRFGDTQIKRMVRILRSTVMVRVGGGWETLDDFLGKHDPCRAKDRTNIHLLFKDAAPSNAIDTMRAFTKNRHAKDPKAYTSSGTPGPIMKIREKTERSLPMFGVAEASGSRIPRYERTPSDLSLADSRLGRPSTTNSRNSLLDDYPTRPDSRGSQDSERPTRIPSLRPKKSTSGSERSYPATSHKH